MPATYEPIATTTLSTAASSITFSSIPGTYTDLRLVLVCKSNNDNLFPYLRFNSDNGANYSRTVIAGDGTTASSFRQTSVGQITVAKSFSSEISMSEIDIFSYAGSTNKTILVKISADKNGSADGITSNHVGLWRSTAAITTITLNLNTPDAFAIGTTATLFGILKA